MKEEPYYLGSCITSQPITTLLAFHQYASLYLGHIISLCGNVGESFLHPSHRPLIILLNLTIYLYTSLVFNQLFPQWRITSHIQLFQIFLVGSIKTHTQVLDLLLLIQSLLGTNLLQRMPNELSFFFLNLEADLIPKSTLRRDNLYIDFSIRSCHVLIVLD